MNQALFLVNEKQQETLASIKEIVKDRFYSMEYTADYKLDTFIQGQAITLEDFTKFAGCTLLDGAKMAAAMQQAQISDFGAGCAVMVGKNKAGEPLFFRGYDYPHDPTAMLLYCHPENGYRSIGMCDMSFMNLKPGFVNDGATDLSILMLAPYITVDGINEKGVAIAALALSHDGVKQETGKIRIPTTTAIRMILDRAATTNEAIELWKQYDMWTNLPTSDFHFMIMDSKGVSKVIEYVNGEMRVLDSRYVTNSYLTPNMGENPDEPRFNMLRNFVTFKRSKFEAEEGLAMMRCVSVDATGPNKSQTIWTSVMNLTQKTVDLCFARDYDVKYHFEV